MMGGFHLQHLRGRFDQGIPRQKDMAVIRGLVEREGDPGHDAARRVRRQAEVLRDLIGGAEADPENVGGEPVRVAADDGDRLVAILLVDLDGEAGGDAVPLQK